MSVPAEGEAFEFERTFTRADVRTFTDLSGDRGGHHVEPDEDGRLLVHGLLTATMPTRIGGRHDVLAATMRFEFRRPVYTGQPIRCRVVYTTSERREDGDRAVAADATCTRVEDGTVVLHGEYEGTIRAADA